MVTHTVVTQSSSRDEIFNLTKMLMHGPLDNTTICIQTDLSSGSRSTIQMYANVTTKSILNDDVVEKEDISCQ